MSIVTLDWPRIETAFARTQLETPTPIPPWMIHGRSSEFPLFSCVVIRLEAQWNNGTMPSSEINRVMYQSDQVSHTHF